MRFFLGFVFLLFLSGCATAETQTGQTGLSVTTIAIETPKGLAQFTVEIADTPKRQQLGLMFRKTMSADAGMIFDFHSPRYVSFWMKNTILPLDILFVRRDGTIATIAPDAVPYSLDSIPSGEPVRWVIELNAGRSRALGIRPGARVRGSFLGG